jgi:protocatechuate 3,4-dioxygenase beta subunit
MKKIVFYISVLLFVVISNDVYAQNYTITGRVVDLDGNPVNGAVVVPR